MARRCPGLRTSLLGIVMLGLSAGVWATDAGTHVVGVASVIDGDTIDIHDERIRIEGIDAPESDQMCVRSSVPWPCGRRSALALSDFLGRGPVDCSVTGFDKYRRILGVCAAKGRDIADFMVREGWAIAYRQYSSKHVAAEEEAHRRGLNMWDGQFEAPWDYRRRKRGASKP